MPPPPLKKEGHIALHMSVGRLVCRSVGMSVKARTFSKIAKRLNGTY